MTTGKVESEEDMQAPVCSIVIRAYNEEEHIGRLLEGILQQTVSPVEIVLVDSGSTDATVAIASGFPVEILHIRPDDFSFGRSLNLGISHACGQYIAIASAHVYPVYPDWLERLLAPFSDPQVGLTYGKQRGNQRSRFSERQILARWYGEASIARQAHPFCNNANAAIRRELWEIHPYDEALSGLEDLSWARWALDEGYGIAYSAEAEVIHVHEETPRGVYNRYRREAMAFKRIFPEENFHLGDFTRLLTTNVISDLRQAANEKELLRSIGEILWFRFNQFWGTYKGYRQSGPLTWKLRQTFYYPHESKQSERPAPRDVKPIRYHDTG